MDVLKIIVLTSVAIIPLQCTAQKDTGTKKSPVETVNNTKTSIQKIQLEEITLGSRRMVTITPTEKIVEINRKTEKKAVTSDEWNRLIRHASSFDIKTLNSFKAPTSKRLFDGAMAATLKITANQTVYESQGFDSGTPPQSFADLYFAVASSFKDK